MNWEQIRILTPYLFKSITKICCHNIVNLLAYCLFDMFVWMENEFHILVDIIFKEWIESKFVY